MRIGRIEFFCLLTFGLSLLHMQPANAQNSLAQQQIGGTDVATILSQLGAKIDADVPDDQLAQYAQTFRRIDLDADGQHSKSEFIERGQYLTPQARREIFNAADDDQDGFVTNAEYTFNRTITDEAKSIVQAMDDSNDGAVQRAEFLKHTADKFADKQLAPLVFAALDTDGNGQLATPEYLRTWCQWARAVRKAEQSVKPDINKRFLDPGLDVSEWLGRFEIESREVYAARETVLAACDLKKGDRIADVGAGTGFYSRLFADAVGAEGWVYAVDISPRFLEHVNQKSQEYSVRNLTSILGTDRSIQLPPNSIDIAFTCDTYHHFEYPQSTLASIYRALKPGGTLVIIDFDRIPGKSRDFILGHVRAGKDVFQLEVIEAGFKFIEQVNVTGFEENYLLRFRKD